ncbi:LytR/AlgR family response regulator transcription factor [Polaromonas sp.]|uniref:LytR/AlgR family response regulator transcription factor n=1 Tax=Polaromonas sp. TaxID=1869339 RepID=UPI002FC9BD88
MSSNPATALIAEDEPLLAQALQAELARAWPGLRVLATVGDGASAVVQALQLLPDVLFFDIRMPGQSGLEAAAELADAWPVSPTSARPFPALVFVTAYDQYAVEAFEAQAVDYLLKPVQAARLQKTVSKVQLTLAHRAQAAISLEADFDRTLSQLSQLRQLLSPGQPLLSQPPLQVIQASVGSSIRMVPVAEVIYFEAADKYIRVLTAGAEYLIRTPLKELLPQLDTQTFWQVHRGTVVRAGAIDSVTRDDAGKLALSLRGRPEKLPVSRLYSHLFRAM